jgi:anionic cell wall polymer biosynthesis LytR-Cps2A-Psr (LCP) family protein
MGRHGRPEPDALAGLDVAAELEPGPVVDVSPAPEPTQHRRHRTSSAIAEQLAPAEQPMVAAQPLDADQPAVAGQPVVAALTGQAQTYTPMPASTASATVVARRHRKTEREARRNAARRQLLLVGAAVLAVLLVIGVTVVVLSGRGDKSPVATAPRPPHQSTLLVQVAGADGTAVSSALVGVTSRSGTGAALLIPAGLLVDDASSGNTSFGETLTLPSKTASTDALTDLLGVRVNDRWVLSQQGLAALVDKVGGVQVTVDVDVINKNAKGDEVVVVHAGSQKLNGAQAAAYATYLAEGEPETVRLARFNDVFDEVLRSLPANRATVAATLTGLATGSTSSLAAPKLANLLDVLRAAAVKETLHYDVLPVNNIDTGDTVDTYGLDSSKANTLLQSLFAPSLQKDPTGDTVRVLVENGVGTPDLLASARAKLVDAGFRFITGGNASELSATDATVVLIEDGSQKSQARGARVAKSLKLPSNSIQINPRGQTVADVIVILGADFKP